MADRAIKCRRFASARCMILALAFLVCISTSGCGKPPEREKPAATAPNPAGCRAEWHRPREVLVHTPQDELLLGIIHPDAALFEGPFSTDHARREHQQFVRALSEEGAKVHTVAEVLLAGTVDESGQPIEGKSLDDLRSFARECIDVSCEGFDDNAAELKRQEAYVSEIVSKFAPRDLVRAILMRPSLTIQSTGAHNTGYVAKYEASPVMNLYFMRDPMITTAKGVVVGRMNSKQRAIETKIAKFVLQKLGISPIHEVDGDAFLEGGDFLPAGDIAFVGQGLRTNEAAVKQLLDHKVFGTPRVAVCKDSLHSQSEMHLDTYFNIGGPKLAVLAETRMNRSANGQPRELDRNMRILVDLYELRDGEYEMVKHDVDFQQLLEKEFGFTVLAVSADDQLNRSACNFVCTAPGRILAVAGTSAEHRARLEKLGIDAKWLPMPNLRKGYGSAHCMVQVLRRSP